MFTESSTETLPDTTLQPEAAALLELPLEMSNQLTRWCTIPSLGPLAQTCRLWNQRINNDDFWKERIHRELTKHPRLKLGQTYKDYYIEIYHNKFNISYRRYLTEPLVPFSEESDCVWNEANSLDACLISACATGCEIWAEEIILRGANVNRNFFEINPLDTAVRNGHPHIIELLYKYAANVNIFIRNMYSREVNRTPLHALMESPEPWECTKRLFAQRVKVVPQLHNAVIRNDTKHLTKLLSNPQVDVNRLDGAKMSALAWALFLGRKKCAALLMEANASVLNIAPYSLAPQKMGEVGDLTALTLIIYNKSISLLKLFLRNNQRISDNLHISAFRPDHDILVENSFIGPLEWCVKSQFPEGLKILLEAGIAFDLNLAVCVAAESEFDPVDCLAILITARPNLNHKRITKTNERKDRHTYIATPLTLATKAGNAGCVKLLLMNGAQPNIASLTKSSYRNGGVWEEQPDRQKVPLQNAVNYLTEKTRLYSSYQLNNPHVPEEYRREFKQQNDALRAEFEKKDYSLRDPQNPISFRALACIKVLLEYKADTNDGYALSHLIESIDNPADLFSQNTNTLKLAAIEILFEHGAALNSVKISGLHRGLKIGCLALIKVLIEKGNANLEERDERGRSVMEVALEKNSPEIIEYLEGIKAPSRPFTF